MSVLLVCPAVRAADCTVENYDTAATVKYVHDGDTVHLADGSKVRLIGINTPELARDNRPAEAYATDARDYLESLLAAGGNRVRLVYGKERKDRYERTLAHLFTLDGSNLQQSLIENGFAAAITFSPNDRLSDCYHDNESGPRCEQHNIWSENGDLLAAASELNENDTGFHVVSGTVEYLSKSDKGIWLFAGELMIGIHKTDLSRFNQDELLALEGKQITARGWVSPKRKSNRQYRNQRSVKSYMRVRHPSSLTVGEPNCG